MKVLLFGRYAEVAGWRERELAPAPRTLNDLMEAVSAVEPGLAGELRAPWTITLRNSEQVRGDAPLLEDDEVAFLPPMSGG